MDSYKRSNPTEPGLVDDYASGPPRKVQRPLNHGSPPPSNSALQPTQPIENSDPPQTIEGVLQQNDLLKQQLAMVLEFIERSDLVSNAPASIRTLLDARPKNVKAIAETISSRIAKAHRRLAEKVCNAERSGVTSDDISGAMVPLIHEIDQLANMGQPDSLKLAYELIIKLTESSYAGLGDDSHSCGFGDRPSDKPADELLMSLIERRLNSGHSWDIAEDLKNLDEDAEYLEDYGIRPWCPKSRSLLREKVLSLKNETPAIS
ncbi:hypothetical protein F5B20DRAFT_564054 [Whalleya microplaca]|nr:hypothetical protein F5B20DRAFT_564054 [Whalleya microplaca]